MFSHRTNWDLSPNGLQLVLERVRAQSHEVIDLTESNPTRVQLRYPEEEIVQALADARCLRYRPEAFGILEAREAVCAYYLEQGIRIEPAQVLLTASSSEAYSYLLALLCDPGTSILVPRPSYPLFDSLAQIASVRLDGYGLLYDGAWGIDTHRLASSIDSHHRAIFLVSPNNPTGSMLREQELRALEEIAQAHDLALVSDEVFSDFLFDERPGRVRCVAAQSSVLSFSLGGLSKAACLPQMKLGWIVVGGPEHQRNAALSRLEMIADTFLSVGTAVQCAAKKLLALSAAIRSEMLERVQTNLRTLHELRSPDSPVSIYDVEAGWYAVLRVPRIMTDEQWAELILEQEHVLVHPGTFFGFPDEGHLVVGLIGKTSQFSEGVSRLYRRIREACA